MVFYSFFPIVYGGFHGHGGIPIAWGFMFIYFLDPIPSKHGWERSGEPYDETETTRCWNLPICSMYGIFTNICPKNHPNVVQYTIHGASGLGYFSRCVPCGMITHPSPLDQLGSAWISLDQLGSAKPSAGPVWPHVPGSSDGMWPAIENLEPWKFHVYIYIS